MASSINDRLITKSETYKRLFSFSWSSLCINLLWSIPNRQIHKTWHGYNNNLNAVLKSLVHFFNLTTFEYNFDDHAFLWQFLNEIQSFKLACNIMSRIIFFLTSWKGFFHFGACKFRRDVVELNRPHIFIGEVGQQGFLQSHFIWRCGRHTGMRAESRFYFYNSALTYCKTLDEHNINFLRSI